jgi:hypothetical protein
LDRLFSEEQLLAENARLPTNNQIASMEGGLSVEAASHHRQSKSLSGAPASTGDVNLNCRIFERLLPGAPWHTFASRLALLSIDYDPVVLLKAVAHCEVFQHALLGWTLSPIWCMVFWLCIHHYPLSRG